MVIFTEEKLSPPLPITDFFFHPIALFHCFPLFRCFPLICPGLTEKGPNKEDYCSIRLWLAG